MRTEQLDLPFVVAAVLYPAAGNASSFDYGGEWTTVAGKTASLAPVGSRWRARIRGGDGVERTARALAAGVAAQGWSLGVVTDATVALSSPPLATLGHHAAVDVPTHVDDDAVGVWVNPRVTVDTDFAGQPFVRWAASEAFPECGVDPIRIAWLRPGELLGRRPPADACAAAVLAALDAARREEIATYDVFFAPEGRAPQSFWDDPRLDTIWNSNLRAEKLISSVISWAYLAPQADDAPPFVRSESALPSGDVLIVEHTTYDTAPALSDRSFAATEGTTTAGCEIDAALVLDTMFGTALHVAGTNWDWSGTAACVR